MSLSARRAWIEIFGLGFGYFRDDVPSLSARRAWIEIKKKGRARRPGQTSLSARRAWIEMPKELNRPPPLASLSARRAWIEIPHTLHDFHAPKVALRKESVDRNLELSPWGAGGCGSLSARRAWIEIDDTSGATGRIFRRSPQGERG